MGAKEYRGFWWKSQKSNHCGRICRFYRGERPNGIAAVQKSDRGRDRGERSGHQSHHGARTFGRSRKQGEEFLKNAGYTSMADFRKLSTREIYEIYNCLLYTSPSPRDGLLSRMPS